MVANCASKHLKGQSYLCPWSRFWAPNLISVDLQSGSKNGSTTQASTALATPFLMALAAYTSTTTQKCCVTIQARWLPILFVTQQVDKSKSTHFPSTSLPRNCKRKFFFYSTSQSTWRGTKMSSRRRVSQIILTSLFCQQDNRWEGRGEVKFLKNLQLKRCR